MSPPHGVVGCLFHIIVAFSDHTHSLINIGGFQSDLKLTCGFKRSTALERSVKIFNWRA